MTRAETLARHVSLYRSLVAVFGLTGSHALYFGSMSVPAGLLMLMLSVLCADMAIDASREVERERGEHD